MASQYITFMIVFTLGLSLVILTNSMFMTLSDEFQQSIAEIELQHILDLIQGQIQQTILLPSDFNQTVQQQMELPTLIGQRFRYFIEISNTSDNEILLHGFTSDENINQTNHIFIGVKYTLEISESSFQSTNAILTLHIQKNGENIAITIS